MGEVTALVVAGGVAANASGPRARSEALAAEHGLPLRRAAAGAVHRQCRDDRLGRASNASSEAASDPLDIAARPRWPLDPDAEPVRGAGVKA